MSLTPTEGPVATLRQRLRYRWDNSGSRAVDLAQRASAPAQTRLAFAQTVTMASGGSTLTLGYVGIATGLRTILPLAEQLTPGALRTSRSEVGRGSVRALCAEAARAADLVIVGGPQQSLDAAGLPGPYVDAPFRVHLVREIPADAAELMAQVSKRDRYGFRRDQRTHGFESEVVRSSADLADFYTGMHLPTMRRRHGAQLLTEPLAVAQRELLAHGFLFFVRSGGTRVAGALCTYDRGSSTVTTRLLGVDGGDERHYETGAFKGLYHLLAEWCRQHGVRRLDLFATQAWTAKGIFQWKRRLHPRVVLPPNRYRSQRIRLHVVRDNDAVRDFLVANPLLTVDRTGSGLVATWFHDGVRPRREEIRVGLPGVEAECSVDLDDFLGRADDDNGWRGEHA
jgi:hypothetical protein